ncbi:MAG: hypothetical protein WA446_06360 [Steroidobacteraceae bacterium]
MTGKKRGKAIGEPWQKVKIDWQIVATANVADLPLPRVKSQTDLFETKPDA